MKPRAVSTIIVFHIVFSLPRLNAPCNHLKAQGVVQGMCENGTWGPTTHLLGSYFNDLGHFRQTCTFSVSLYSILMRLFPLLRAMFLMLASTVFLFVKHRAGAKQ